VPIYLSTPGFDGELEVPRIHTNISPITCTAFTLCPSALGTYCSPTALLAAFSDIEVFYHVYAAGQKLTREDLWVSLHNLVKNCDSGTTLQGSVQKRLRRESPTTRG